MWPRRSEILAPLTRLTSKDVPFQCTDVEQQANDKIKSVVSREVLLLYPDFNSLDTEKKICYTQKTTITVLTFYDGILLSSLPHARATHSLQAELFVSLQDQLQSTHCIYCRFDSCFRRSFVTAFITLANNDLFSIVLKMSAEETPPRSRQRTAMRPLRHQRRKRLLWSNLTEFTVLPSIPHVTFVATN
jgi:hypothetical protein